MGITIERVPTNLGKELFKEVFGLILELHAEVGVAPLNPKKYGDQCYSVISQGMTFVARADGVAVGTIGLIEDPFWYSDWSFLHDKWLYVRPEFRRNAGFGLLRAARDEGLRLGRIVYIWNTNPDRKQKASPFGVEAQRLAFVPFGFMMRLKGMGDGANVLRERDEIGQGDPGLGGGCEQARAVEGD